MFNLEEVKGYSKLDAKDKELFGRFYQKFYKAWEYPEDHAPTSIKRMDSKYLKVVLSDGDWLHILKDGSWY
ncbi:hypothetical protein [Clostridium sp. 001]|uniref:hypothetical protein n=1 Tax=Clostridium sp. 001 TaxID=1970093 RepID=UPI001C2BDD2B|nr:hypothetical protein [Clostridium sp. 001]QXE19507.1 hypothetical protein B5S50_12130 [Clostridium sp. 001]